MLSISLNVCFFAFNFVETFLQKLWSYYHICFRWNLDIYIYYRVSFSFRYGLGWLIYCNIKMVYGCILYTLFSVNNMSSCSLLGNSVLRWYTFDESCLLSYVYYFDNVIKSNSQAYLCDLRCLTCNSDSSFETTNHCIYKYVLCHINALIWWCFQRYNIWSSRGA